MEWVRTREDNGRAAAGGIVAGAIGGTVLSLIMLVLNHAQGYDIWAGMKGAGMPFLGEQATLPGFDLHAVVVGVSCHFAVSIVWGLLFGLLFYGFGKGATVALGAMWGVVVWVGMYYVVLPLVGLAEVARSVPVPLAIINHVAFGLVVGLGFLPFQRMLERRPTGYLVERPHAP
jgi:hypothetical protein